MKINRILILLMLVSAVSRIIYTLKANAVWWDTAVYVGMGKYIFSFGTLGLWEPFRPMLWPIILGFFWKINLNPLIMGKILEILFSLATIYLVYIIGEKIDKNLGIIAATLLSFTFVYFTISAVQITDIPSLFFSLLAIYLILNEKYVLSGLSSGIAFALRFPHGITLIILLLSIFFIKFLKKDYFEWLKSSSKVVLGFMIIALPYFISNYLLYKDIFFPLKLAGEVIVYSARHHPTSYLFYFKQLLINNFLLIFSFLGLILYFIKFKKRNKTFDISLIALILFTFYFSFNTNRETRYLIAFLPYFCLFSAYGVNFLISKLKTRTQTTIILVLVIIFSVFYITFAVSYNEEQNNDFKTFNDFPEYKEKDIIYSSNPLPIVDKDIKLIVISSWEQALGKYNASDFNFVSINSCDLYCGKEDSYCFNKKEEFLAVLSDYNLVLNKTVNECDLWIYKLEE